MNIKKILLIGGGGYIGTQLAAELLRRGHGVAVLGRKQVPEYALPRGVTYHAGDFSNKELIDSLLDAYEEVVHLAYATVPNTSFIDPLADLLQNLPPTVQLFSEIAKRGAKLILVSSGGTVYGEALALPIGEGHAARPISPYGVTKLTLENYAHLYASTHGLKFICVRPANAFGVGQRPFVGQGFISTAIASAIMGLPIKIFGKAGAIRDYLYITDVASGIASALESGHLSETYNLGSGTGLSNQDVVEAISPLMRDMGFETRVEHLPERAFDVKANVLDSTKLRSHTGWNPQVGFSEGLRLTANWLKDLHA